MPKFGLRTLLLVFAACAGILAMACPAVQQVREAARRTTCRNNLRQIVLAMHNYESACGHLPIGIETNADGTLRRSWRTRLYPSFMESAQQFYDPNFAWDSPVNARLYDGTPVVATDKGGGNPRKVILDPCPHWCWCCPSDSTKRVNYSVVIGDKTAFPLNRAVKFDEITDGLENAIVAVESLSNSSIWTEPGDIQFDEMKFLIGNTANGELSSKHPNGVNVAFADGKIYFLENTIPADDLRALFTISGNESVTRRELLARGILH